MYLILDQSDFTLASTQFITHPLVILKRQCGRTSCLQRKHTIRQINPVVTNNLTSPLLFHGISNSCTDPLHKWPLMHSMNLTKNGMPDIYKSCFGYCTHTCCILLIFIFFDKCKSQHLKMWADGPVSLSKNKLPSLLPKQHYCPLHCSGHPAPEHPTSWLVSSDSPELHTHTQCTSWPSHWLQCVHLITKPRQQQITHDWRTNISPVKSTEVAWKQSFYVHTHLVSSFSG